MSSLGLDGECSFPLLPGPEGKEKKSNGDDDAECGSVDDQVRVHLRLLGVGCGLSAAADKAWMNELPS